MDAEPRICALIFCDREASARTALCNNHRAQKNRYGLTDDEVIALYALKDGLCHLCELQPAAVIDHDHACCAAVPRNKTARSCGHCNRGVLCHPCNLALGHMHDDVEKLRKAISYLSQKVLVAG